VGVAECPAVCSHLDSSEPITKGRKVSVQCVEAGNRLTRLCISVTLVQDLSACFGHHQVSHANKRIQQLSSIYSVGMTALAVAGTCRHPVRVTQSGYAAHNLGPCAKHTGIK
jgi:hypothetical protein